MTFPPPTAWVGFAIENHQALVKVCPRCDGAALAREEAKPLPTKEILCPYHYQMEMARRYP